MAQPVAVPDDPGADLAPALPKLLGHPHDRPQKLSILPFRPTGRTRRREVDGVQVKLREFLNADGCRMWSTAERLCPCGRPTVTVHHEHCATCIRHAPPVGRVVETLPP